MGQTASIEWWNKSLDEVGIHSMDKLIAADTNWAAVQQSGRDDLARAIAITGMTVGRDRTAVEVGCGLGRMSAALADHFGRVVGVDIAPRLIEEARFRNELEQVTFEVADGVHLRPESLTDCDTVFSYEVFYYINPRALAVYFRDAFQLLRSGGQFVFQLNMEPVRLTTRLSFLLRRLLYSCGIKHWRGWPTGAGYRRYHHSPEWLRRTLTETGFRVDKIAGPTPRQTWIVAVKPHATATVWA
jgi:SAM-dependent methyltransferase